VLHYDAAGCLLAFSGAVDFTIIWQHFKVQFGYLFIFLKRELCSNV
jgi:hypothetical protein